MSLTGLIQSGKARDKHGLLLSLLGLLIVIEAFTVFVVLASQQYATDRALREHTRELLQNVVDETRENSIAYLRQAQDSVSLAAGVFEARLLSGEEPGRLETYFLEQLQVIPQIDALYFGDIRGNFIFSKRNDDQQGHSGFLSKIIQTALPDEERVTLIRRDPTLVERARDSDPDDSYDPRQRPWFKQARASDAEIWTDPYIFYTSQQPGLTVARAVRDEDGHLIGAMGADIELTALSNFLRTQRVGSTGAAFVVYSNGDVLAHPDAVDLTKRSGNDDSRLKKLADLDPITARAGTRLRERFPDLSIMNHTHLDDFEVGDKRYLSMFVPLLNHGAKQWVMGVYAPEDELAKTIRRGQRESIYLGVAMSLLSITAVVLLGILVLRPINTLQEQARQDPLTGLLNRRSFDQFSDKKIAIAIRGRHPLSAVMIDVDYFKPINDEYGHAVGDEVLQIVARRINRGLSDDDLLSRYGGEEFAVLLPDAALDQAVVIAERLREQVGSSPIKTSAAILSVTVSLGVAQFDDTDESIAQLLERADRRLLIAKRRGRDCVVYDDQPGSQ